jgi:uncharacterized RDD family membrane protein YckC
MENFDQILDAPVTEGQRHFEYAGFWIRVGAYIIDALVLAIPNFVLGLMLPQGISTVASLILGVVYFGLMESSENQATVGKMAVGIKVGDENGDQISFGNAVGRHFAKILSALLLCIGFMMVGWDERNQGLHDKLANTFVFYARNTSGF